MANLILDQAERRPLSAEVRNRLAARAAVLRLETITPWFGSLERDPVHPSAYYLAVDGARGEALLLYLALATAPTSSIFYKPLLIGRTRRANGPEMVINAVPFSPADHEHLAKFAAHLNPAFLPRPQGSRTAIAVAPGQLQVDVPAAFAAFRAILKRTGKNLAAIRAPGGAAAKDVYYAGLWAAIRAGWREGYTACVQIDAARIGEVKDVRDSAHFSTFTIDLGRFSAAAGSSEPPDLTGAPCEFTAAEARHFANRFGEGLKATGKLHESIRQARSSLKAGRTFEFELAFDSATGPTTPLEMAFCLHWLRPRGIAPQYVAPNLGDSAEPAADLETLASVARHYQCVLSIRGREAFGPEILDRIARATAGRVNYTVTGELAGRPGYIDFLAAHLVG